MLYHIIVNPAGASGRTGRVWKRIEPIFRESGQEYEVHYSSPGHGIADICRELEEQYLTAQGDAAQDRLVLITIGGDGSVNEAMNGIADPAHVYYGHIPAGSGNDIMRDMKLSKNPEDIARRILEGRVRRYFDVGELEYMDEGEFERSWAEHIGSGSSRRFAISCGIGFDAGICEMSGRSRFKDVLNRLGLGKLIYLVSAFRLVHDQKSDAVTLTLDAGTEKEQTVRYDHVLLLACMNHQHEGGGFRFAPKAAYDDGLLDLCIADPAHNSAFYKIFPFALFGEHYRFRCVHACTAAAIDICAALPMWVHTDGEVERKACRVRVRVLEEKLAVLE